MSTPFTQGGEQRVVSVISNILTQKNNEVFILCVDKKTMINYEMYKLNKKVNIIVLSEKGIFEKMKSLFLKIIRKIGRITNFSVLKNIQIEKCQIIRTINDNNFEVVIGVAGYYSVLLASIKNKINSKVIGWQHNSFDAYFRNENRYYWKLDNMFIKSIPKLDKYIVLTKSDKEKFKKEFNVDTTVIYNPKSFNSNEISRLDNNIFLAAGRYTYAKGFDMLIDAFKIFAKKNEEWRLIIVGEGEEKDKLQQMILKYSMENRITLEPFTNNIKRYMLNASALLISSRWEGMPMVVLEAMEMGLPVIGYNIPVLNEIIENEKEGMIIEKNNVEEYAQVLIHFSQDDVLRKKLSKNIKIKSENFSHEKIGQNWEDLLTKVCNKK